MEHQRYATITELGELLRLRKVSPVELVTECLERIERLQPRLNAFITVTAEQALREAREAEAEIQRGNWRGPLHGIPVGLKDFFDTAGIKTTAAFAPFKDRVPARDAEVVTRIKAAGAIILGKLNMHELGMGTTSLQSYFGAVHNPWNADYIAGGSSGGSAAALAAGLCYATVDTDAVGSCRLPAACCGVVGFKGTYGLLSTKGILEGEPADDFIVLLSHTSVMCRAVEDVALLLNALARPEEHPTDYLQAFNDNKKPVIGITRNMRATDEVRTAFTRAIQTVRALGYTTREIDAPLEIPALDLVSIEANRAALSKSLFQEIDVLLLPTTIDTTPSIEDAAAGGAQAVAPDNTFFCNYYSLPALTLPCGFSSNGLPLGLQFAGPRWGESEILNVAYAFQQATTWHRQHPSM